MTLSGKSKYGPYATKEDIRKDIIAGIRKNLKIGDFNRVYILEKRLITEYKMTPDQIENEIYS